jgi:hypothetical protein
MEWLRSYRPDLVERYEELYARSAYAPAAEQERLQALVRRGPKRPRSAFQRDPRRDYGPLGPTRASPTPSRPAQRAEPQQTTLF